MIRTHRLKRRFRSKEVAEKLGISLERYLQIEHGKAKISFKELYIISLILNVNIKELA